jgi:hypothetical protein
MACLQQEGLLVVADSTTPGTSGGVVVAARKLQIRRKACSMANLTPATPDMESPRIIKASRDVRCPPVLFAPLGCCCCGR